MLLIDHDLAFVTSDNESFRVGPDRLDVKAFAWRFLEVHLELTVPVAEKDFTLVCSDEEFAFGQPAMTCVVV